MLLLKLMCGAQMGCSRLSPSPERRPRAAHIQSPRAFSPAAPSTPTPPAPGLLGGLAAAALPGQGSPGALIPTSSCTTPASSSWKSPFSPLRPPAPPRRHLRRPILIDFCYPDFESALSGALSPRSEGPWGSSFSSPPPLLLPALSGAVNFSNVV